MRYADLTHRIAGKSVDTWTVHYRAMTRLRAGEDVFLLSVGQESDVPSPPGVVEAGVASIRAGRHHYTAVQGESDLRRAIAERHGRHTGHDLDPARVTVFAGAQNALFAVAQVTLQAGDEVILLEPYYTTYPATFTAAGATLVSVRLDRESGFQLDAGRVIRAITPRTRAIVINSPNNPTGAVYPRDPLQTLVEACRERGVWLIADDVYADIVDDPTPCRPCSLPGADAVVITVSSLSKTHRMTGWRIGWTVGPPELATHLYNLNMCMSYGLPGFTQDAALHALRNEHEVTGQVARQLHRRREVLIRELAGMTNVEVYAAGGGMFVMMNIAALGVGAMAFASGLLDNEDVAVQPCTGFGDHCDDLIRISAVLEEDRLTQACKRIRRYIASLG